MSNQFTTFVAIFTCAAAVTVCSGCDPSRADGLSSDVAADAPFKQVEKGRTMDSYSSATHSGDVAFFLGSWELPPWESCALVRVFRQPDYPLDVWIDWLDQDLIPQASRPVDLKYKFYDTFELDFADTGDNSGLFSLVANIKVHPDAPLPDGTPIWAMVQPCH